ncbi:MAG: UDP-N-acetylglucosamine 2-epimerase [Negativicutes bacterium]|jgi:UDP-N-acetylglucosamine 2-epimerase (non-hydrolysing)/GDP/UDP-N,N'-diacetylbacillosamine 2-epimerase (hydrolysing)
MSIAVRKICVVTGSRADYGLMYWLLKEIQGDSEFILQIVATGMHLSSEFGLTYKIIEQDGFSINEKVEMLLASDTPVGVTKSIGVAVVGFADTFARLAPDIVILLGDRYEIMAAAQAALIAKIPIAHIAGGDTTEGAFDEAIRHCITKMAHLHFVTNEQALLRVLQLGENPEYVFNFGSPGIDYIKKISLLDRENLEKELDFRFQKINLLITFHPVTLEDRTAQKQFYALLSALDQLGSDVGIIFTKPNSDTDGKIIIQMMEDYVLHRPNAKVFTSLGQLRYLSAIAQVDAVVGNSSSGLYEVPSFNKPTVNIGNRQKGRLHASSVINCKPEAQEIFDTIQNAFKLDCSCVVNPYGAGNSSKRIFKVLKTTNDYRALLQKHFFEVAANVSK